MHYWGNTYTYDAWGNLREKVVTKCSSEPLSVTLGATNRILNAGYGYDAAGNMTLDGTDSVSATYDEENRIASATKNGVTTAYIYDADGNRVEKLSPPPPATPTDGTLYWYMTPGIVAESDLSGVTKSEYVFFNGERVARRDFGPTGPTGVFYYFSDHLKTASVITDAAGNIKSDSDYYPWGGELQFVANDPNHYKFTGKERDTETGLDYFGARYYSNGLGRFTSVDPKRVALRHLLNPQKLNKYTYVLNNPIGSIDPDGLEDIKVFIHFAPSDTMPQNEPNWKAIQKTAAAHGNTVTVFRGDAVNEKNFQTSLAKGGTTVFIGHSQSVDNGKGVKTVAISLSNKEIGQPSHDPNIVGAGREGPNPDVLGTTMNPGVLPTVNSSDNVALFGCATNELADQYSGANSFVAVDSSLDHGTSTDGLLSAGGAFVADLAAGKPRSTAVADANKHLNKNPRRDNGDRVEDLSKKKEHDQ